MRDTWFRGWDTNDYLPQAPSRHSRDKILCEIRNKPDASICHVSLIFKSLLTGREVEGNDIK